MSPSAYRVAVTGASGFFGAYIVEALLNEGFQVRAVVREPGLAFPPQVKVATADLLSRDSLVLAFQGVDAVVGNAAMATPSVKGWEENYLPNTVGTENVLEALRQNGIRRYVHISTIGVYDIPPAKLIHQAPFSESHPLVTPRLIRLVGAYRVTKALAENVCSSYAQTGDLDLTILRTSATYGHRDPTIIPALRRYMKWPLLPAPQLVFSLVYAADAALAVSHALRKESAIGQTFNVAGSPDNSVAAFLDAWKRSTGEGPRLLRFPLPIRIAFDNSKAEQCLGFRNRPLEEGIQDLLQRERLALAETT